MIPLIARALRVRIRMPEVRWILLGLESCLTALPFTVSWMLCAVILSTKAGYLMAKADSADKAKILEKLWTKTKKSES